MLPRRLVGPLNWILLVIQALLFTAAWPTNPPGPKTLVGAHQRHALNPDFGGNTGNPELIPKRSLAKRGLEVVNNKNIILRNLQTGQVEDLGAISDDDNGKIKIRQDKMDKLSATGTKYTSAIHAFYDYDPLEDGQKAIPAALNFFWPPQSSADTIPELKTSLDAATKKWRSTDSYKYLLGTLTSLNSDTEISRIVAIGLGSLQGFSPFGSQDFIKKLQGWAMTQLALVLAMQSDLAEKNKKEIEVILQDPAYSPLEGKFMSDAGTGAGTVRILNDPDGFDMINKNTVFVTMGTDAGIMFKVNSGILPAAILTDILNNYVIAHKPPPEERFKDLMEKYEGPKLVVENEGKADTISRRDVYFYARKQEC